MFASSRNQGTQVRTEFLDRVTTPRLVSHPHSQAVHWILRISLSGTSHGNLNERDHRGEIIERLSCTPYINLFSAPISAVWISYFF